MAVDGRKDLIEYLPPIKQNIRELKAKFNAGLQPEIDNVWLTIRQRLDDSFASTASTYGLRRFEKIYNLVVKPTDTIQERRFRVLARMNERLPYTYKRLQAMLDTLLGVNNWRIVPDLPNYHITVKIMIDSNEMINSLDEMLKRVLPANMTYEITLRYNKYKELSKYTYRQLSNYTYGHVREGSINTFDDTVTWQDVSKRTWLELSSENW
jgi:hypothetical protein